MKRKIISAVIVLALTSVMCVSAYSDNTISTGTRTLSESDDENATLKKSKASQANSKDEAKATEEKTAKEKTETDDVKKAEKEKTTENASVDTAKTQENQKNSSAGSEKASTTETTESGKNDSKKPASCNHNWEAQYRSESVPAKGHYEPIYETVIDYIDQPIYQAKVVCGCGATFDSAEAWGSHSFNGCNKGYSVQNVIVGYNKVQSGSHQVQTGSKWVEDQPAHVNNVLVGYVCTKCGASK